jgi:uncharacterized protein YuzE
MTKQTAFGFLLGSANCWNKHNNDNMDMEDFIDHLNETLDSYECQKLGRLTITQLKTVMDNFTEGRIAYLTINKVKLPVIKFESYDDDIVYIDKHNKIHSVEVWRKKELNDHYLQHKPIVDSVDDIFNSLMEDANMNSKKN